MPYRVSSKELESALVSGGADVTSTGGETLLFSLQNGDLITAQARIDDCWISVRASWSPIKEVAADGKRVWSRLLQNGRMAGPVRFAVGSSGDERLRADIPLEGSATLEQEIAQVCRALKGAYGGHPEENGVVQDAAPVSDAGKAARSAGEVRERFGETGWDLTVKDEHVSAALDVPGRYVQARIHPCGGDAFRASVSLLTVAGEVVPVCQHGIALFLLSASNAIRLVRPAAYASTGRTRIGCEVHFQTGHDPSGDLSRVLSALSVATDLCLQEVRALTDESVCAAYLGVRGANGNRRRPKQRRRQEDGYASG